ncbi:MAG: PEGA domain-containing protein [Polyangia bacterium]
MSQSVKVGSVSLPDPARGSWLGRTLLLALSLPSLNAVAQPARTEPEPPPAGAAAAPDSATREWCALPLCRDAEGLRQAGDLQGALKLYRYIQEEVDVDEKVLRKPLLWFVIASLHKELQQPQQGLEALAKYQQYLAARPDTELPAGQLRKDTERLREELLLQKGHVRIRSNVSGLRVLIDGKDMGTTPIQGALPVLPGHHRVEILGSAVESQDVDVPSGQEVLIWPLPSPRAGQAVRTDAAAKGDETAGKRPRWRLALGAVGIGAGLAFIAGGAAALAGDGRCVNPQPDGRCPIEPGTDGLPIMRVTDGRGLGGGLLAAGAALAITGTVLLALPGKRAPVRAAVAVYNGARLHLATAF